MGIENRHLFTTALFLIAFAACNNSGDDSGGGNAGTTDLGTGGMTAVGTGGMTAMGTGGTAAGTGGTAAGTGGTAAGTGGTAAGTGGMGSAGGGMAEAMIKPFGGVMGVADFTQSGTDVTVTVTLMNCPDGMHPVHIHEGTSCDDATMQGAHWGMTRGEGIPDVMCTGGMGTSMLTRTATDATLAWSIGGDAMTDVVGHVVVVHDPPPKMGDPAPRIGCGKIATGTTAGADAGTGVPASAMIEPFGGVTGTAAFTQTGTDVSVTVTLMNCPDGMHPVHIHEGTSCDDAMMQGAHWGMTRGEGISDVMCTGGMGTSMLTRMAADPTLAWSIGGDAMTDVVGHVVVVHNPPPKMGDPAPRIGCGKIAKK